MIKYLRNSEIDKDKWDKCINRSPQGETYALSWYLDIVSPGWDALISDDYKIVFPLTKRKKFGFKYLHQPFFTQQLGLFSSQEVSEIDIENFLHTIPTQFRLIEIQLNAGNKISSVSGFKLSPRKTHLLNLSENIVTLRKNYSENLRRNLKKAMTTGFNVSENCEVKDIIKLFRNNRGKKVDNLKDEDYSRFEILMKEADRRKSIECLCMKNDKSLLAGAIFLNSVHSRIFLFSAVSEEGRKNGAMSMIIDNFIERHCGDDKSLDFEGSMDENLARYYKSFGSKEVVYLQVLKNNLPPLIRWLK